MLVEIPPTKIGLEAIIATALAVKPYTGSIP
jgi:hypothetical protein